MAKKTASQIVLKIFANESLEVCEQLLGIAREALRGRRPKPLATKKAKKTAPLAEPAPLE